MTTELEKLREPFDASEIKFFATALTKDKSKGKVAPYADARCYMERLDHVLGPEAWSTAYEVLDQTRCAVECRLSIKVGDEWVTKSDVGYPNEAKDADNGDKEALKAAYSDALKRACVQWGVGRFLYVLKLRQDWLPVDEYGKFKEQPVILKAGEQPQRPVQVPVQTKPEQWGTFATEDGQFDQAKWDATLKEVGITTANLRKVAPKGGAEWRNANPDKSMDDLLLLAQQSMEAA